jgi:molybdopterin molybdotransferase
MLGYDDALARVLSAAGSPLPAEIVPARDARGRALTDDLLAPVDLPPFDNSAVDGYAVRLASTGAATHDMPLSLPVTMEIPAGRWPDRPLRGGEAARIFTGAPLPDGADALVMVEDTEFDAETGRVTLRHGGSPAHIRRRGSDLAHGALAIPAGTTLGAGALGLLAALGIADVRCPRRPRVGVLTTGDELVRSPTIPLQPGQIRDANGPALVAALTEAGAIVDDVQHAADTVQAVRDSFAALSGCDVIVSSGGVSVGDHDHVRAVLEAQGRLDFWRIALKPGKPLAFGRIGESLFVGLPGNPVSSLVTFELFVRPLLRRLAGHSQFLRPCVLATLSAALDHAPGRREFVRARVAFESGVCTATPTGAQGSHRLHSLIGANALLIAHEDHGRYDAGQSLPALLLSGQDSGA